MYKKVKKEKVKLEKSKSSVWREADAIRYSLEYSNNCLTNKTVKWHTNNYTCNIIAKSDSKKDILQELALDISNISFENKISLEVS